MSKGFSEGFDPCNRKAVTEVLWTAPDGTQLGSRAWMPAGKPKAIVLAMHGLGCRAADFEPLGIELKKRGVAVCAWNHRGQGLDPDVKRRGAWFHLDQMLIDLKSYADTVTTGDTPVFLCGESLGALIALQATTTEPWSGTIEGLLLFSPAVALSQKNPPWLKTTLRAVGRALPGLRLRPGWFVHGSGSMPRLTRVEERQKYLTTAPHRLGPLTLPFLASVGDLIEASLTTAARVDVPVAMFSGGNDVFTTPLQFEEFFAALRTADKTHFQYPEGCHQLLFDFDASKVVEEAAGWLLNRISRK